MLQGSRVCFFYLYIYFYCIHPDQCELASLHAQPLYTHLD